MLTGIRPSSSSLLLLRLRIRQRQVMHHRRRPLSTTKESNNLNNSNNQLSSSSSSNNNNSSSSSTGGTSNQETTQAWLHWGPMIHRLAVALGLSYCFTEYVAELTLCEGPSMMPTIYPQGELILVDRFTHRFYGIHHGTTGKERFDKARQLQEEYYEEQTSFNSNNKGNNNDPIIWYATTLPKIHYNRHYHPNNSNNKSSSSSTSWKTIWKHKFTSPLCVGDVVVVQHPHRPGTVCKRILGLPGDTIVGGGTSKNPFMSSSRMGGGPSTTTTRRGGGSLHFHHHHHHPTGKLTVIPDGHVWLEGDNPRNSADSRTYGPVPAKLLVGRVLLRVWPLRGRAWMERGQGQVISSGTTILPAGYEGEVMESISDRKARMKNKKKQKKV